jgi:hypothetical protein
MELRKQKIKSIGFTPIGPSISIIIGQLWQFKRIVKPLRHNWRHRFDNKVSRVPRTHLPASVSSSPRDGSSSANHEM